MKTCKKCQQDFEIIDWDKTFLQKINAPEPTLCPDCRSQRRKAHINQIFLFERKCDATQKSIVTNYPPDNPLKVFSQEYWFGDGWDAMQYGREFDFNRPFFEQFDELNKAVPRPALFTDYTRDENSAYTNYAGKNRNCYLIFDSDENQNCYYSFGVNSSLDSGDCYRVIKLELCYEAIDSNNCYNCSYIQNCENCADSVFLQNCVGCKNCYFSSNLIQKENYLNNKPASADEIKSLKEKLGSFEFIGAKKIEFDDYKKKFPQKFQHGFHNENVTGDYNFRCKDAQNTYDSMKVWGANHCTQMFIESKDCLDVDEGGICELLYETTNLGYVSYNIKFSMQCLNEIKNLTYCNLCESSSNLFGCVGLRHKQYCILNKQYTKEEYEQAVPKIIEHMKNTDEWGEYFPIGLSSFPYNLTRAQIEGNELKKEEAEALGASWHEEDKREFQPQSYQIIDSIGQVNVDICEQILACVKCGRNYKITAHELSLYKKMNVPIPRECFYCRHKARYNKRNPRHLWDRNCQKCNADIKTTYPPERSDIVYCEKCYQESLA